MIYLFDRTEVDFFDVILGVFQLVARAATPGGVSRNGRRRLVRDETRSGTSMPMSVMVGRLRAAACLRYSSYFGNDIKAFIL